MRTRQDTGSRPKPKAILFTDIVGSTEFFQQHGDQAGMRMLDRHNRALFPVIEQANGLVVKTIGDSILAIFDTFLDALTAAAALQQRMQSLRESLPETERIHIRIGVHYGLVSEKERDVYGDAVNLADRIKGAAAADQTLVSRTLRDLARSNREMVFATVGVRELKGQSEPMELFALVAAPGLGRRTLLGQITATHRRLARYYAWGAVAIVATLLLASELPPVREHVQGALFGNSEKHIAVLPIDNIGNDPANEALAEGLMDSMTGELTNLDAEQKKLWVVPASVIRSRRVDDPSAALKQFGATLVVKGSLLRTVENLVITLQLINCKTLRLIGAARGESATGDLAAAQMEAITQLAHLLNISVDRRALASGGSSNAAAYELYVEALGQIQRYDKPGNLDNAIQRLKTATTQDSNFALGYAAAGEAYRLKFRNEKDPIWLDRALAECAKAIKLDPQLPRTYVTLGRIHEATGQHDLAVSEFQRALAIDSRNAEALRGLATAYESAGRLKDAENAFQQSAALFPADWDGYNSLALFYDRHARIDDAIAELQHAMEIIPDSPQLYYNLGAFYLDKGDPANYAAAETAFQKSLKIAPTYQAYGNLGQLYLQQGRYQDAIATLKKALSLNSKDLQPWVYLSMANRWTGNKPEADTAMKHVVELAEAQARMNPRDFEAQSWLGLAYAKQGLREKALAQISAALAQAPTNDQTVLINAIEAYDTLGNNGVAVSLMQRASRIPGVSLADLKLDPDMQPLLSHSGPSTSKN